MWRPWFRPQPGRRRHGSRRPRLVPRLEALEDRELLSAEPVPTALVGYGLTVRRGQEFAAVLATFQMAGPAQLTAAIDWGDGAHSPGVILGGGGTDAYAVIGTGRYAAAGTFTITVTLDRPDSLTVTVTSRVVVYDLTYAFGAGHVSDPEILPTYPLVVDPRGTVQGHPVTTGAGTPAVAPGTGGAGGTQTSPSNTPATQPAVSTPPGTHVPATQPAPPASHVPATPIVQSEASARTATQYVLWQRTPDHAAPRQEPLPLGSVLTSPTAAVTIAVGTPSGARQAAELLTRVEIVVGVVTNATDPVLLPGSRYRLTVTVPVPAQPAETGPGQVSEQSGVDSEEVRAVLAFAPPGDAEAEEKTGEFPAAADDYFVRLRLLEEASRNLGQLTCADAAPEPTREPALAADAQPVGEGPHGYGRIWRIGATWVLAQVLTYLTVPRFATRLRRTRALHRGCA
jgi:hypothetical protein